MREEGGYPVILHHGGTLRRDTFKAGSGKSVYPDWARWGGERSAVETALQSRGSGWVGTGGGR